MLKRKEVIINLAHPFFDKIKENKKGFIVINKNVAFFASVLTDIQQMKIRKSRDELIFFIHDNMKGLTVRSYPLDESNSAVITMGRLEQTDDEIRLLKQLLYKAGIIPDENIIHSIIPRRKDWNSIMISDDLADELKEMIKTDEAEKLQLTTKSQIITAATREFLLNFYNKKRYRVKSGMENITLDYTIIGRYIFCNICSLYDCKHIELFFEEDTVRADLEKEGIRPIRYKMPKGTDFPEESSHDITHVQNRERTID